eukprot:gnl/TRDRNA2_/TRDRNA2_175590_c3_seq1.p1 gnl/TRDRNA2_/TRDRNA2_175590_c3~~gnl/TRDRNA2_/TRDRNA2_175590_c3_seq1.p1  ORF type:complete len:128 (+),score=0.58 gnl/TRDRNA2_/TRDRNA2_175590_c3_seq1:209-592(+)
MFLVVSVYSFMFALKAQGRPAGNTDAIDLSRITLPFDHWYGLHIASLHSRSRPEPLYGHTSLSDQAAQVFQCCETRQKGYIVKLGAAGIIETVCARTVLSHCGPGCHSPLSVMGTLSPLGDAKVAPP